MIILECNISILICVLKNKWSQHRNVWAFMDFMTSNDDLLNTIVTQPSPDYRNIDVLRNTFYVKFTSDSGLCPT